MVHIYLSIFFFFFAAAAAASRLVSNHEPVLNISPEPKLCSIVPHISLSDFPSRLPAQSCRGGRFSLETTLRLGVQMVSLLRMLHSTGYVHRDIKPENFCVVRESQYDQMR